MGTKLHERAILVKMSQGQWKPTKRDKAASEVVWNAFGTDSTSGAYYKRLMDSSRGTLLAKLRQTVNSWITYHYAHTLPWISHGMQLLPMNAYMDYIQECQRVKGVLEKLRGQLRNEWSNMLADAEAKLSGNGNGHGSMFNIDDYPDAETVADRYYISVEFHPVPQGEHVNIGAVGLLEEERERIVNEVQQRADAGFEKAQRANWERLYKVVKAMVDKFANEWETVNDASGAATPRKEGFKPSLIGNIQKLVDMLPNFNLTDDPDLELMRREVESKLCGYDYDDLQSSDDLQKEAGLAAQDILDKMSMVMG